MTFGIARIVASVALTLAALGGTTSADPLLVSDDNLSILQRTLILQFLIAENDSDSKSYRRAPTARRLFFRDSNAVQKTSYAGEKRQNDSQRQHDFPAKPERIARFGCGLFGRLVHYQYGHVAHATYVLRKKFIFR